MIPGEGALRGSVAWERGSVVAVRYAGHVPKNLRRWCVVEGKTQGGARHVILMMQCGLRIFYSSGWILIGGHEARNMIGWVGSKGYDWPRGN